VKENREKRKSLRPDVRMGLAVATTIGVWARVAVDLLKH
jgi:hypothetical protein